jgi:4-oxalocrotonate tautomerase
MPFIRIELAGSATREQKAAIVGDVTRSMVERLGKPAGAVQVVIAEHSLENYGSNGILIADRAPAPPTQEVAPANGPR